MTESAFVTLLFTDLVGSTELSQRLGEDASEVMRREHTNVLRAVVESSAGKEVKHLGDGLMVVFTTPSDAVGCAIGMQQAVERENRKLESPLGLRVGLHAGEVTREQDDYFGTAVVVAERLCKRADGGQILASDVVRVVVGTRGGRTFKDIGPLELRGIDEPVPACELHWEPVAGERIPFPTGFPQVDRLLFVGREPERQRLRVAWKLAMSGQRQLALLAGEPGIGKTRLATELALDAHDGGATVLYGRCDEDLGAPYQPFAEALRHYVSHCELDELEEHIGRYGGEVGRLVPELYVRVPDAPKPTEGDVADPQADREAERFRVFEAAVGLLTSASARNPLLLVLDDLHWASRPTLLMLRHVLRTTQAARLMIVGTYRDTDLDRTHPFAETLADLRRELEIERIPLRGLDEDGVASFVQAAAGQEIDDAMRSLVHAMHAETEGNPFFVGQVLRHLAESGAVYQKDGRWTYDVPVERLGIPEGVREVVGRRMSRLSEAANRALAVASVMGAEFDLAVLERVPDAAEKGDVLDALDEAVAVRIVDEVADAPGRYRFTHTLVRQTLYEELTSARRVRLHERVGEAIEQVHADDIGTQLQALARHFGESARSGGVTKASSYAMRAARHAIDHAAPEEAIEIARRGLQVLDIDPMPHHAERSDLYLIEGFGHMRLQHIAESRACASAAADEARACGSAPRLARAAWAFSYGSIGVWDQAIALCEEALAALGSEDDSLRALVQTSLVFVRALSGHARGLNAVSREAVELARASKGDENWWFPFFMRAFVFREAVGDEALSAAEEQALAAELLELAVASGDRYVLEVAHRLRAMACLRMGDRSGYERGQLEAGRIAEETRSTLGLVAARGSRITLTVLDGRLEDAERLTDEQSGLMRNDIFATVGLSIRYGMLRLDQGRPEELVNIATLQAELLPASPGWWAVAAVGHAQLGRAEEARKILERLVADDFSAIRSGSNQTSAPTFLAYVCAYLGEKSHAHGLYELLAPHAGRFCTVADAFACMGAADRFLGIYAALNDDTERSDDHFRTALELEERLSARTHLAYTRYWWARMRPERSESEGLLEQAVATASETGMAQLEKEARQLRAEI